MPKQPPPQPKLSPENRDAKRSRKFRLRLTKNSEQVRKQQLKPDALVPSKPGVRLSVNVSGNLRGLNNADNSAHMSKVRAMRRFYNKQMPVLQCANCAFASSCPQFKAGYECAFLPFLNAHKIETEDDLIGYMKELLGANMRRVHLTTIMETLGGGQPSLETSEALNLSFMQLAKLHELTSKQVSVSAELDEAGTIIGKLFGGLGNLIEDTKQSVAHPIEVEARRSAVRAEGSPVQDAEDLEPVNPLAIEKPKGANLDLIGDFSRGLVTQHDGHEMESVSVGELKTA